jgi:hypothetical protein
VDKYEQKVWHLPEKLSRDCCRALIGLKTKEKPELSASTVAFYSYRVELRMKFTCASRCGSVEGGLIWHHLST